MESPVMEFLTYLVRECVEKCDIDPDTTTVTEFLKAVEEANAPVGF